ncbi:MAG TPA: aspartate aminotransferase family protein, partial [Acidimicrobiales bacterium]|nr:aspartate aminotransferase family protein [Acidimicrobiales bacterium]
MDAMHRFDPALEELAAAVFAFARRRAGADAGPGGVTLGRPQSPEALDASAGRTITAAGIGAWQALRLFTEVLEPACLSTDFPRYLAFVPAAPSEVSILADLVVSACSIYGGSWLEGSG